MKLLIHAVLGSLVVITQVCAQSGWRPEKQVEIILPTAPGGGNDTVARLMAKMLQEQKLVTTPILAVNKPGGNQAIALAYLVQHAGDPHFLKLATTTLFTNQIQGLTQARYVEFPALAFATNDYSAFMVSANSSFKTMKDLTDRLKTEPESVAFSVVARGGTSHAAAATVAKAIGVDVKRLKIVVFKTSAEATTALMGGHIQASVSSAAGSTPPVVAGQLRMLAIAAPQRKPGAISHVPTLAELGIDVPILANWRVVLGARGITPAQVAFWEDALARAFTADEWKAWTTANDAAAPALRGVELQKYLEGQYSYTRNVLIDLGLAK
ncbi:MAG: tripartite tricarboxylate transporter substrate binding protein [Pseudomonadota bacterium]